MKTKSTQVFSSTGVNDSDVVKFVCDKILHCNQFVEYCTNKYFVDCDTFSECVSCLHSEGISCPDKYKFSEIGAIPSGSHCVVVEFSTDEDFTKHDVFVVPIPQNLEADFIKRMEEDL